MCYRNALGYNDFTNCLIPILFTEGKTYVIKWGIEGPSTKCSLMFPPCFPQKWSTQGDLDPDKSLTTLGRWRVRQVNVYCSVPRPLPTRKRMSVVPLPSISDLSAPAISAPFSLEQTMEESRSGDFFISLLISMCSLSTIIFLESKNIFKLYLLKKTYRNTLWVVY